MPREDLIKKKDSNIFERLYYSLTGPREFASPSVREFLLRYGQWKILRIDVGRQPIQHAIDNVVELASFGEYSKNKLNKGYDLLFHLFMVLVITDGKNVVKVLTDKREIIKMALFEYLPEDAKYMRVPLKNYRNLTLEDFFFNGEDFQGVSTFYLYDPITNNCQNYCASLLEGNDLHDSKILNFVLQDVTDIVSPTLHNLGNFITNIAARFDILKNGVGNGYEEDEFEIV